jgi:hypothetical protein
MGGKVLSLLHDRTSSFTGDPTGQELCLYLTQKACVPYMEILEKWVYKGVICDPYQEVSCFSIMKINSLFHVRRYFVVSVLFLCGYLILK